MRHRLSVSFTGAISFGLLITGSGLTSAAEVTGNAYFGWLAVGPTFTLEPGHLFFAGEFSGSATDLGAKTIFDHAAWQCPGSQEIDANKGTALASGHCAVTISTGDKAFGSWHCEGSAPMGPRPCEGIFTFTTGTGKLAGIAGTIPFRGRTVFVHADGKASGYTDFDYHITLP